MIDLVNTKEEKKRKKTPKKESERQERNMHNFFVILLMFPLQEILCNRNVDFTNHKSDHLIKHYNQRELPPLRQVQTQWHNQAYPQHGQMLSSDRFISSVATDSNAATMTLTRPPPTPSSSMVNYDYII